ncbi:hypothetical protein MP638_003632 [Amoeboaphelidium occidentale]|nr:hypothetical protein MP638_003632 [Amoeboaphelidium occidentale]
MEARPVAVLALFLLVPSVTLLTGLINPHQELENAQDNSLVGFYVCGSFGFAFVVLTVVSLYVRLSGRSAVKFGPLWLHRKKARNNLPGTSAEGLNDENAQRLEVQITDAVSEAEEMKIKKRVLNWHIASLVSCIFLFAFSLATYLVVLLTATNRAVIAEEMINLGVSTVFVLVSCILLVIDVKCCWQAVKDPSKNIDDVTNKWNHDQRNFVRLLLTFLTTSVIAIYIFSAVEGWSHRTSSYFLVISFSTVGYGNVVPTTIAGKYLLILFGLFSIGLLASILGFIGKFVVKGASRLASSLFKHSETEPNEDYIKRVTGSIVIAIALVVWFVGAAAFSALESWSYTDSLYFCFVTLSTIGYGDFVPQTPGGLILVNYYVFLGIGIFASLLNLNSI